ncbi:hypothetical protein ABZ924_16415 [Streptomyces sp. NPDC046876]|uniref:hypothetical protein n=1 Tax=Streptomyces sp. NPDC046876 TaxID=3155616 RepID=UPI0034002DFC
MGWRLCAAAPIAVMALLFLCSGTATLTRGWMPRRQRGLVRRPGLFGWAQVVAGLALGVQLVALLAVEPAHSTALGVPAVTVMLLALSLIPFSHRPPGAAGRPPGR